MNQDAVVALLIDTEPSPSPFTLAFSGKSNDKVNGLYKPDKAEIVLHNHNFESDDQLVYTALHEYAHHLHHCRRGGLSQARSHTNEFWAIFHDLLVKAEAKGHYRNVYDTEPEFLELTARIREQCIHANGELMLEFGRLLAQAADLCRRHRTRFEDYVDRVLGLPRQTATAAVAVQAASIDPSIGWDNMRMAVSFRDPEERAQVVDALKSGASPAAVKGMFRAGPAAEEEDPADRLLREKERLERSIRSMSARLEEIERKLSEL